MEAVPNTYAIEYSEYCVADNPLTAHPRYPPEHEPPPPNSHNILKQTNMAQAGEDFPAYKASQASKVPQTYLQLRLRIAHTNGYSKL
jgi:hypothetical protein